MFNKTFLIGRLGADAEVRQTGNGTAVANLRIATTEKWNKDGQTQERTEWHTVVFYGNIAQVLAQYGTKGTLVFVEGQTRTNSYEKNGETRYATEIRGSVFKFLSGKKDNHSYQGEQQAYPDQQQQAQQPQNGFHGQQQPMHQPQNGFNGQQQQNNGFNQHGGFRQ